MIFFFKQKTAYEMRISDWSSDVCSSDLIASRADALRWRQANLAEGVTLGELLSDGSMPVVHPATPATDIANQMIAEDMGRICVVDPQSGALIGIIARRNLLSADRTSVVQGKSVSVRVDIGSRGIMKKKITRTSKNHK